MSWSLRRLNNTIFKMTRTKMQSKKNSSASEETCQVQNTRLRSRAQKAECTSQDGILADANGSSEKVPSLSDTFGKKAVKKIHHGSIDSPEGTSDGGHSVIESTAGNEVNSPQKKKGKRNSVKIEYENDSKQSKWEPSNWMEMLRNIREMRKNGDAPVDSMGCDKCMDDDAPPEVVRYQTLVSLMLSSQTRDEVTHAAMDRLRKHGCTVENILKTDDEVLAKLIYPVGFTKKKVQYLKRTATILQDEYNSDIPDSVEKLCKLPGVGPKMAHLCMDVGWGIVTGIGVDTHVHRISNRIGWVPRPTKTPEGTREALESWLPSDLWSEVNHLLVGFGQTICRPVGPQCGICLNSKICPSAHSLSPKKSKAASKKV